MLHMQPTDKHFEATELAYWAFSSKYGDKREPTTDCEWVVDVSQNLERTPWGSSLPQITPHSVPYVFSVDRVMTAEDSFTHWITHTILDRARV